MGQIHLGGSTASVRKRRVFTPAFKAKVALESLMGERSTNELATYHKVHANQIAQWRKQLIELAALVFTPGNGAPDEEQQALINKLGASLICVGLT